MYQILLMSSGTAIHRNLWLRGQSDVSAQRPSAFYLAESMPLLSAAAIVLNDEQEYPHLGNNDQNLANSDQTVLNVGGGGDNKIGV
jgi:hypothetical protein